jgi:uncharacterized protein (TIGR02246 family)
MQEPIDPLAVAQDFVRRINSRDPAGIAGLMTDDHTFVDATGASFSGRETIEAGWAQYFQSFPDYAIEVEEAWADGPRVALFGRASGSRGGASFRILAAWSARVEEGRISRWTVYCDVEPMLRALGLNRF